MELQGKYCKDCKIFTDDVEEGAVQMVYSMMNSPMFESAKLRFMPDIHLGIGSCIGTAYHVGKYINPSHIGVDIGCGIEISFFDKPIPKDKYPLFEHRIRQAIPMGFDIHKHTDCDTKELYKYITSAMESAYQSSKGMTDIIDFQKDGDVQKWLNHLHIDLGTFLHSIGTLGGGNHFIEYDENEKAEKYGITVHTGSRNLGQHVHKFWSNAAKGDFFDKDIFKAEVKTLKKTWHGDKREIPAAIEALKKKHTIEQSDGFLTGDDARGYLTDMVIAQAYASFNRLIILRRIAAIADHLMKDDGGINVIDHIASIHNYIDFSDMILRKGAIRSYDGERMIIPFNMRDGLAICEGKSNEDWNCTAPHGSGRAMSRSKAKEKINLDHFKSEMKDVYSTSVTKSTLDEAPDAYKPTDEIINNIKDTCDILFFMKPKINIKDTTVTEKPWQKK